MYQILANHSRLVNYTFEAPTFIFLQFFCYIKWRPLASIKWGVEFFLGHIGLHFRPNLPENSRINFAARHLEKKTKYAPEN